MLWAQIVNGTARDVVGGDEAGPHVAPGYNPNNTEWVRVPDGTQSGAVANPDGSFTNPPAPPPPARILSKTAFQDYAVSHLGGSLTGMARFQAIMDACAAGSGAVKFCFSRYEAADTFEKSKVSDFTQIMVGASIMTSDERNAILNNWPAS